MVDPPNSIELNGNSPCFYTRFEVITVEKVKIMFGRLVCDAMSTWILKMEAACSSKTLVPIHHAIQHYIPEHHKLNYLCSIMGSNFNKIQSPDNFLSSINEYLTVEIFIAAIQFTSFGIRGSK
jgi:hypothetical protein